MDISKYDFQFREIKELAEKTKEQTLNDCTSTTRFHRRRHLSRLWR